MENSEKLKTKSDILIEFLEVAFHSILYYRGIYPKAIFCLKKKYQVPIHVSIYPELNQYITECLKTVQQLLQWEGVQQIALVILTEKEVQMEKFCFNLSNPTASGDDQYFIRTEEVFRQYLLKLSVVEFKKLPENCSFQIQITTNENCSVRLSHNLEQAHFPWIDADQIDEDEKKFEIYPVKTLETNLLSLNMYIEK